MVAPLNEFERCVSEDHSSFLFDINKVYNQMVFHLHESTCDDGDFLLVQFCTHKLNKNVFSLQSESTSGFSRSHLMQQNNYSLVLGICMVFLVCAYACDDQGRFFGLRHNHRGHNGIISFLNEFLHVLSSC